MATPTMAARWSREIQGDLRALAVIRDRVVICKKKDGREKPAKTCSP